MRGRVNRQSSMFVALNVEDIIPETHPLRKVKKWADAILVEMRGDLKAAYSDVGRPGIPPEQMLKALLLRSLYAIPSERRLMEAIEFNLLYRWFLDLPPDERAWTPEAFSMNRDRFLEHNLVRKFFDRVVAEGLESKLISNDHFTVDGTLIRSWASHKSVKPIAQATETKKDDQSPRGDGPSGTRDQTVDWRGERRSNATHRSTTDPDARYARKGNGREAHLSHSAHVMMENRSGLCLDVAVDFADGKAERRNAIEMLRRVERRHGLKPRTLGADTGYDDGEFLVDLELQKITPHVPVKSGKIKSRDERGNARRRARRRMGQIRYEISQRVRKRIEQIFGWKKTVAGLARTRFIGHKRIWMDALMSGAAFNLLRMTKLRTH
jgi:transposase